MIQKLRRLPFVVPLSLLATATLTTPVFGQAKLKSVAVAVNDLGNPFFVQVVHGAR